MKQLKHMISRRRFLRSAAASSLLPLLPGYLRGAMPEAIKKPIPASGESLAVIGVGTSRTFEVATSDTALAPLAEVLQAFFDGGGQLIDSSPMYGSAAMQQVRQVPMKTMKPTQIEISHRINT